MGEKIIQPPFYNSGFYNTGAGGGGGDYKLIGGRSYRTVIIGGVEWLAENLDFKFSGCKLGGSGTPTTPSAWYYDNDEDTYGIDGVRKCGLLYNWYAVKLLNENKNDIIPGWHVPSDDEWKELTDAVGGSSTAGTKLKASNVSWASTWGGTDEFGFDVLPAGDRRGAFYNIGNYADFWTIDDTSSSVAINRYFSNGTSINTSSHDKTDAYSVRLVRD